VIEAETARRRALALPPFGGIAEVAGAEAAVVRACELLRPHAEVRGPTGAHAMLRAPSAAALSDALAAVDLRPPARSVACVAVDAPRVASAQGNPEPVSTCHRSAPSATRC
jgi:hypothetical protein